MQSAPSLFCSARTETSTTLEPVEVVSPNVGKDLSSGQNLAEWGKNSGCGLLITWR